MCTLAANTDVWLGRAVVWRNEQVVSLSTVAEQLASCAELSVYLTQLKLFICRCPSISSVLAELPVIGQLLGRLCSLPALLQDQAVCATLLECLARFCPRETANSVLEHKAKAWAMTQIRSIAGVGGGGKVSLHMSTIQAETFYQQCHQLVLQHLRLKPPMSTAASDICLCLGGQRSEFLKLLEVMLHQAEDEERNQLMKKIRLHQENPYTGRVPSLSAGVLQALWLWDISSLEHEMLDMITVAARIEGEEEAWDTLRQRIIDRGLSSSFSHVPVMWHEVAGPLLLSLWQLTGHRAARRLLLLISSLLPVNVQTMNTPCEIRVLLAFSPRKLTVSACSHLLKVAAQNFMEKENNEGFEINFFLLHPEWWNALTLLPLVTSPQVTMNCSHILSCYFGKSCQESLTDFLNSLRGLLHKAVVSVPDVQCCAPVALHPAIVSHCCCVFLLLATDTPQETTRFLMEQVCELPSPSAQLFALNECLNILITHSPQLAFCTEHLQKRAEVITRQLEQPDKGDRMETHKEKSPNSSDEEALWDSLPDL